jgi:hypothetical protein
MTRNSQRVAPPWPLRPRRLFLSLPAAVTFLPLPQGALAPKFHGAVDAAGCQKRRRRVKRHRGNGVNVPLQSRHTSHRRVVENVATREDACPQFDRAFAVEMKHFSSKDQAQSLGLAAAAADCGISATISLCCLRCRLPEAVP